jgi:hypothetical protein
MVGNYHTDGERILCALGWNDQIDISETIFRDVLTNENPLQVITKIFDHLETRDTTPLPTSAPTPVPDSTRTISASDLIAYITSTYKYEDARLIERDGFLYLPMKASRFATN